MAKSRRRSTFFGSLRIYFRSVNRLVSVVGEDFAPIREELPAMGRGLLLGLDFDPDIYLMSPTVGLPRCLRNRLIQRSM